jgi:hypothetical protein
VKIFVAVLAVLIALAVLNPEMRDFREHVEGTIGDRLSEETDSSALRRLGAGAVALLAEQISVRNNYFLFSTYTIDLDGPDREDNDWHFLGVGGFFIQLREPADQSSSEVGGRS